MKSIVPVALVCSVALSISCAIQGEKYRVRPAEEGLSAPLFPVVVDNKLGFMDRTGKIVIKPQYDFHIGPAGIGIPFDEIQGCSGGTPEPKEPARDMLKSGIRSWFSEGLAPVLIDGRWGYIDKTGRMAIEPQFVEAYYFRNGLALVKIMGTWTFIDRKGAIAATEVKPKREPATRFSDGLVPVKVGSYWGFRNRSGEMAIPAIFNRVRSFSEGLACVNKPGGKRGNTWGFIDTTGKIVIERKYSRCTDFHNGLAMVMVGDKYGFIDKKGEWVWKPTK